MTSRPVSTEYELLKITKGILAQKDNATWKEVQGPYEYTASKIMRYNHISITTISEFTDAILLFGDLCFSQDCYINHINFILKNVRKK